jgi:hypothetical protein
VLIQRTLRDLGFPPEVVDVLTSLWVMRRFAAGAAFTKNCGARAHRHTEDGSRLQIEVQRDLT